MAKNKNPTGVKVISILFWIASAIYLFFSIAMLFIGPFLIKEFSGVVEDQFAITFLIILGTIFLGIGVLNVFIGIGLWKLKNWARITALVLIFIGFIWNCISALFALISIFFSPMTLLFSLIFDIPFLILYGWMIHYLLINKQVKQVFKK